MSLNVKPRSGESQSINFKISSDLDSISLYSQQFFTNQEQTISYPSVFDNDKTVLLISTEKTQIIGSLQIPQNIQLKYRSEKTVTKEKNSTSYDFYYTDLAVTPVK
jgi:hypothetical protein